MSTNALGKLMGNIAPARVLIFDALNASDVATLCYTLPTGLTHTEKSKYLAVTRDFGTAGKWIEDEVTKGREVVLIGSDLKILRDRIMHPSAHWNESKDYWVAKEYHHEQNEDNKHVKVKERKQLDVNVWVVMTSTSKEKEEYGIRSEVIRSKITALCESTEVALDESMPDEEPYKWLPEEAEEYKSSTQVVTKEVRLKTLAVGMIKYSHKTVNHLKPYEPTFDVRFEKTAPGHTYIAVDCFRTAPNTAVDMKDLGDGWGQRTVTQSATGPKTFLFFHNTHFVQDKRIEDVPNSLIHESPDTFTTWTMMLKGQQQQPKDFEFRASQREPFGEAPMVLYKSKNRDNIRIRRLMESGVYVMMTI